MTKSFSFIFLEPGDKVLVVHRRLFESDKSRFFIGSVSGFNEENGLVKVVGYSFCETIKRADYVKKHDSRTKILSLTSGTLIIYQLPNECHLESAVLKFDGAGNLWLRDGGHFAMDLSESNMRD